MTRSRRSIRSAIENLEEAAGLAEIPTPDLLMVDLCAAHGCGIGAESDEALAAVHEELVRRGIGGGTDTDTDAEPEGDT